MPSAEKTGNTQGPNGRAPSGVTPRRARLEELVAGDYSDHPIHYQTLNGEWVEVIVHARELSWDERSSIEEKHTKVYQVGRTQRADVDATAIMRDVLTAMIQGPKCNPPIESVGRLRGPLYEALKGYFQLNAAGAEEVEEKAGESRAP